MIVVLDVGGSSIKSAAIDGDATVGRVTTTPLDHTAAAAVLVGRLVAAVTAVGAEPDSPVALAVPGPFDHDAGVSLMTHKFASLLGENVVGLLAAALDGDRAIRCCNDAEAAVVGEAIAGAGAGASSVLGLTLGTGLGAALVEDGEPVPERHGVVVGDLHRGTLPDGRPVDEALSARGYQARRRAGEADVDAAFGRDLAAYVDPIVRTLDVDTVVVGGGGAASFDEFAPALRAGLSVTAVRARLGPWAPIVGAAAICYDERVRPQGFEP